jgi:23S rRNA (uridine2552-2'-O)-methyltransferase
VFKLSEIDDKHRVLHPGDRVLDLGCAPGSWLQYAAEAVGPRGHLTGVDRAPIELDHPNFRMVTGDILELDDGDLTGDLGAFDVVLSDMAPDTTGIRHVDQARSEVLFERALQLATAHLAPGGNFVGKLFMGPDFQDLVKQSRELFDKVKIVKPAGSRKESIEQYVVGLGFKGLR